MKKILKIIGILLIVVVASFAGFLGFMSLTDYRPEPIEHLKVDGQGIVLSKSDTFDFITWNIGYCGLGKEQDFFFDGGRNVRPEKKLQERYLNGVLDQLSEMKGIDFILLQEVDRRSKRSYYTDQVPLIAEKLPNYALAFTYNYKTSFIPQPLTQPYGRAEGGLLTLSRYQPSSSHRHALAPDASWPTGLFMLKRCFMTFRYMLQDGKELVVVNQHLSAYDDGTVKQQQMDTLKRFLLNEYNKGNYIVVGGDWNQFPPDYKPILSGRDGVKGMNVEADYPAVGWKWAYDLSAPTNRKLNTPYREDQTETVVIDYFLLSPNITLMDVKVWDIHFEYSDHQPVYLKLVF